MLFRFPKITFLLTGVIVLLHAVVSPAQPGTEPAVQLPLSPALPPIATVKVQSGMVFVNGQPFIGDGWNTATPDHVGLAPGNIVRWSSGNFLRAAEDLKQGRPVDLIKTEPLIESLEKSGRYGVVIIEPYWGEPKPEWSQVSWQGKSRGGQGLNTNACWRNPDFIADRLQKVRDIVGVIRRTPRAHDRILGYIVWNEQRWAMGEETCYCPYCRKAWPVWLKNHYGVIARLNAEYATRYRCFEDVPMPTPKEPGMFPEVGLESQKLDEFAPRRRVSHENAWRDFHLFKADGLIEFEKLGAAAAKEADPSRLVITSIFTRGVNPLIGHVLLRLYRALGDDPNIDVIGGNMYEAYPAVRAARHIAMWRSTRAAHRKPVWFTEFNDIGSPFNQPYDQKTLNAMLAHTTFSGMSGRIWFTDRDDSRLGVLEPDGTTGPRYKTIAEAAALANSNRELIAEAARNELPPQVAIIHLDSWNALADNYHYNAGSTAAFNAFTQWAGFSTAYLAEPELERGELQRYKAAVLWQAQRSADISDAALEKLKRFVENGGTLFCDPPLLQDDSGVGPKGKWAKFFGVEFRDQQARSQVAIDDPQIGHFKFASITPDKSNPPVKEESDLGRWTVTMARDSQAVKDSEGQPVIVIHPVGKGKVITFCFRLALLRPTTDQQISRGELLQRLLAKSGTLPLIDCPTLEKTIAPLDKDGLLVTLFNPENSATAASIAAPGLKGSLEAAVIRKAPEDSLSGNRVKLSAGEWMTLSISGKP